MNHVDRSAAASWRCGAHPPAGAGTLRATALGPEDVVVRVRAYGIRRSDATALLGGRGARLWTDAAGEVVETGAGVRGLAVGEHVVLPGHGGHDACAVLPGRLLVRNALVGTNVLTVPAAAPWPAAVLAPTSALARRTVRRLGRLSGHHALVFGAGPLGLALALELRSRGIVTVAVTDPVSQRRDLAGELGLDSTTDPVREVAAASRHRVGAGGRVGGAPTAAAMLFLDAAGSPAVAALVADLARVGDSYLCFDAPDREVVRRLLRRGVSVIRDGTAEDAGDLPSCDLDHWQRDSVMVSHVFHPDHREDAVRAAASAELSDKVVVVVPD